MTDQTAKLVVLEDTTTDFDHFVKHLAAYCAQYIMEVAKPIMEHAADLHEDKAIVKLVDLWFDADRQYHHGRQSYLVQWYATKANDYGYEPSNTYKWIDDERKAYRQALDALLVR